MTDPKIAKQFIDFQKATFDNTFNAICMFQDQAEKSTSMFMETNLWPIPEEGRKMLKEWIHAMKKGREEFKKTVDEGFNKMEDFFAAEKAKAA